MEPLTTFQDSEVLGDDTIPCGPGSLTTPFEPVLGALFQWPTLEDNWGLVLAGSPRPSCQPLPWEEPSNVQCTC